MSCNKNIKHVEIIERGGWLFGHVRLLPDGTPAHDALQASVEVLAGLGFCQQKPVFAGHVV